MIRITGLDIGGANLKAAALEGPAVSHPFALWKNPTGLAEALRRLIADLPSAQRLAVTMTGELCDCYPNRRAGVLAILDAVAEAAPGLPTHIWTTDGCFVGPTTARMEPLALASANWLALATFGGRFAPRGPALLIDIGTTTSDIIPLIDGVPRPVGRTDAERLRSGALVYRGWRRTPLCALGEGMAELFATTQDMCLILGLIPEDANDQDTADSRPATVSAAHARVARMLGADVETSTAAERLDYVAGVHERFLHDIAGGLARVASWLPGPPENILLAGSGEFLGRSVLEQVTFAAGAKVLSLNQQLGAGRSTAACAYAVAVLDQEREARP